jgi:geranylgeranyl pyrophosphate synthase
VASLLHDDVLDSSDTRRGISSLNFLMGNKLAVLAGDFLLARASVALASLRNVEVNSASRFSTEMPQVLPVAFRLCFGDISLIEID